MRWGNGEDWMLRVAVLVSGVVIWALLGWVAARGEGLERVEARVLSDTRAALVEAGFDDIEARVDGRRVTLVGRVSSEALRDSILSLAAAVRGVGGPIADRIVLAAAEPEAVPESPEMIAARACQERFDAALLAEPIRFDGGTATPSQTSYPVLAGLVEIANSCPTARFTVEGHTDASGPDDVNQRVSEARAQAVADYLIGAGVAAPRIVVVGYGETRPVDSNTTAAGRAANRRIQLVVSGLERTP